MPGAPPCSPLEGTQPRVEVRVTVGRREPVERDRRADEQGAGRRAVAADARPVSRALLALELAALAQTPRPAQREAAD